ncbi:MAG: phage head-tail joining protein [Paracoccus sp. (in: a-proteobacteria)]
MPVTVDELTEMRDALIRARAKGVRMLQVAGERVEYKTEAEMVAALADIEARIRRASGNTQPALVRFNSSKGF